MKKNIILIVIIAVLAGVAIFAVKKKKAALAKAKPIGQSPIPVSVVSVKQGDFVSEKLYVGIIEPLNTTDISSRITADIKKILYREGKAVKKGDLLIKLDNRNLLQSITVLKAKAEGTKAQIVANNINIKSLTSSVIYWKKQVQRDKQLFDKNVVSAKQLELSNEKLNEIQGQLDVVSQNNKTLDAELNAIKGDIGLAETNLSYADLIAPFDGVVCDVPVDPGELASPGKKLMVVENQQQLKLSLKLPQIDMKYVHPGDELHLQYRSIKRTAAISKIYPALGANRMIEIEAILPKEKENELVSGQYVKVSLTSGTINNVLIVPSASINIDNRPDTKKYLFILDKGFLKKVNIKILADNETEAAVSGSLKLGNKVVVSAYLGWAELSDGLKAKEVK
jgi:RND family efflux transporter MFP subunit